ncbi:MAG TPA: peptidoglycan DD-metalloendopeptidase family protein [Anaerolineae bacterium]|nr:peptidoglycan DD-metalloendopeptidase family protein [Anaerolineae bacterium]HQH38911.1 peptidoglycan DD-metalloendopeptidase family protein [Anaerolineae bacterium]
MRRKFWLIFVLFLLLSLAQPALASSVAPPVKNAADTGAWTVHTLQLGEEVDCLAQRSGMDVDAIATANRILNPMLLNVGQTLNLPPAEAFNLISVHAGDTPLTFAVTHALPWWDVLRHNPEPWYVGKSIRFSGATEAPCFTYPLTALNVSPQPVSRGRTALFIFETAEPAACEITYLGQTEPCYPLDDSHLYALVGLSALMEPGVYTVKIAMQADGLETAFTAPLTVSAGRYGYQYIDPPASLSKLMDPDLMQGELDYLALWRTIRTPERAWELPLAFPLPVQVAISANYGDRRSYGGMVDGYHSGVDYRAWGGMRVLAPADGVVILAERLEARGNSVLIDHGGGLITGYWHLSRIDVEVGQHVKRGEAFALVGNTGLSTGAHLHWEMWVNGVSVDSSQWLSADAFAGLTLPALSAQPSITTTVSVAP